jgi:2,4-dienoyl-CoA reductase-like NADH-dependent reductase (Old Yellow Enzyme family)
MSDTDLAATFGYVTTQLDLLGIAYLHVVEPRIKGTEEISRGRSPRLRPKFSRTLIAAGGFTPASAGAIVTFGGADLVAFGRRFISNPNPPDRAAKSAAHPLRMVDLLRRRRCRSRGGKNVPWRVLVALSLVKTRLTLRRRAEILVALSRGS